MQHDRELLKTANAELLSLGQGEVAYLRKVDPSEAFALGADMSQIDPDAELWGLYSANGETLALCDSAAAAWHFAADTDLVPVHTH